MNPRRERSVNPRRRRKGTFAMAKAPGRGTWREAATALLAVLVILLPASATPGCGDGTAAGRRPPESRSSVGERRVAGSPAKEARRERRRTEGEGAWSRFVRRWHEFWREEFGGEE